MIRKEYAYPVRILRMEGKVEGEEHLLETGPMQIGLGSQEQRHLCRIAGPAFLILDFGREMRAGLRILCARAAMPDGSAPQIRIRLGESVGECSAECGEKGACNDHAPRDFFCPLVGMSDTCWGQSGFRFARLDIPADAAVELRSVLAEGEILSLRARVGYTGTDPVLSEVFSVAKRTIDLCAAGRYVWDGIKRDRLVWIGDMHPEMLALTTLYGPTAVLENSLEYLRRTTAPGHWMCDIPTYSAWWVIVLADYYTRTGRRAFTGRNLGCARRLIRELLSCVDAGGGLHFPMLFVDWPTHGEADEEDGVRAILTMAAEKARTLFDLFDRSCPEAGELHRRLSLRPITARTSMQVAALKYFACGSLTPEEKAMMQRQGAAGLSTFMSYYILTAYAQCFGAEEARAICRTYYGAMLARGATTFFEDFHMAWLDGSGRIDEPTPEGMRDLHGDYGAFCYRGYRHSLCHAWSSGVIAFLHENPG